MKSRKFLDRVYWFLTRRRVYHGLFWLVMFLLLVFFGYNPAEPVLFSISNEIVSLVFFAVLVYFNLLYLIPKYLARHVFVYIGFLVLACAAITPIKIFVFYLKFAGHPSYRYALVENQGLVFVGNFVVAVLSTVLNIITGWWRYQQEKQHLLTQTMQSELRFLKSQINPHFLFNTLNNLYALTLKKSDKAPEIVLKLSEIMRYMLYECNERRVLLTKEIQYMQNYLDLERLRQPANIEIALTTEGHISDQTIAPLLFIPFLENSFKHGVNNQISPGGYVRAVLRVQDDDLEFSIENSKPEHTPKAVHPNVKSGGIGLANVRQRLDMLYPNSHDLIIENEPTRYAVTLLLKLN